jgi:hypothetical protein
LEVACGQKFCKAGRRIKNADPLRKIGRGRETGGWDFYKRALPDCYIGDRSVGGMFRSRGDGVLAKRIDANDKRLAGVAT